MTIFGQNTRHVKKINKEIIRQRLKSLGSATNAEIARSANLSISTCTNLIGELMEAKEVLISDDIESDGGRPAKKYYYNPDFEYTLCIYAQLSDSVKTLSYVVFDAMAAEVSRGSDQVGTMDANSFTELIDDLMARYPRISTIGIGIPGIAADGVIAEADFSELEGVDLRQILKKRYGVFVRITNEMNYIVYGYNKNTGLKTADPVAYLSFAGGECPGCGIALGDTVISGARGIAGEVKYIFPLDQEGNTVKFNKDDNMVDAGCRIIKSLIGVIDPEVIVLSGSLIEKKHVAAILSRLQESVPDKYIPELIYRDNLEGDYIRGLLELTVSEKLAEEYS